MYPQLRSTHECADNFEKLFDTLPRVTMLEMVEAFLRIRWGENTVHETGLFDVAFTTQFDNTLYTDTLPLDSEAQASNGGSGGPGFTLVNGQWKLSAIMVTANLPRNHQPAETVLFGDQSLFYDLSVFRAEILAIVPKPSSYGLALIAAAAVALARRRRH